MAIIDVQPLVLKDVTLELGTDDYKKHVSGVTFTPDAPSPITWTGLGSNTHTDTPASTSWTCTLEYVQDWETIDSLSQFLYENEGETVSATFHPKSGSGPSFTADLSIVAGAIGGQVNQFTATTVTLGSTKPVLVPAV